LRKKITIFFVILQIPQEGRFESINISSSHKQFYKPETKLKKVITKPKISQIQRVTTDTASATTRYKHVVCCTSGIDLGRKTILESDELCDPF